MAFWSDGLNVCISLVSEGIKEKMILGSLPIDIFCRNDESFAYE